MTLPFPQIAPLRVTQKGRSRVGTDQIAFQEMFQGSALNSAQFSNTTTTFTTAVGSGLLTLNNGAVTTASAVTVVQSYQSFPIYCGQTTYFDCIFSFTGSVPINHMQVDIGLGYASGTSTPTDGVFFRTTNAATPVFQGVQNNNGTETTVAAAPETVIALSTSYHLEIAAQEDWVEFRINGNLLGTISRPAGSTSSTFSNSLPICFRLFNDGTGPASAVKLNISQVSVTVGDQPQTKPWPHIMAKGGWTALQGQTSGTMDQTGNYANSAAPSSATLSNTAAGYTTLGGQWQFATVTGAETDYALFGYQNPAGTATAPGKTLHITGIRISSQNQGATVATTATVLQWAVAAGSTAVSLATTTSATAKAPRRLTLGIQTWAIGQTAGSSPLPGDIDHAFTTPLVVNPGEFFHIIVKSPIGTNTASQIIRGVANVEGYLD